MKKKYQLTLAQHFKHNEYASRNAADYRTIAVLNRDNSDFEKFFKKYPPTPKQLTAWNNLKQSKEAMAVLCDEIAEQLEAL